ncbi:peptidoglycan recognition protein family protein [Allosalinactinospora lopnorensis]|uniref:peptidoglycan recognition protein family protein n=1 Tax=Allosalinactinospora lopnorensis TaxID=1352348 RepID=UPI000623DC04|nr:peptidoglycan recognition family protein [Allosalinactinospora lopnorensis]
MSTHDRPVMPGYMSRRTILRGAAFAAGGVLLGSAIEVGGAQTALASSEPQVYARAYWGARSPRRSAQVLGSGPSYIVVHHTFTANTNDHSVNHATALSRAIQRYHMDVNGWDDIGQQLTISRGGHILEGRNTSLASIRNGQHAVGAHTANHNGHTVGIENEGTYTWASPPQSLMDALVSTCVWLCSAYDLDPGAAIVGHRDFNPTNCPGDQLYSMLPQLRRDVSARLRSSQAAEPKKEAPEERPTYPDLPERERETEHYHGPAA